MKHSIHVQTHIINPPLTKEKQVIIMKNNDEKTLEINGTYELIIANGITAKINTEISDECVINIILGKDSNLELNNLITKKTNAIRKIKQEKNSKLNITDLIIGSNTIKQKTITEMEEKSKNNFKTLTISKSKIEIINEVKQNKETSSNVTSDNFGLENSNTIIVSRNIIGKNAVNAKAHQKKFNLILDETAKISALPILEINNDAVECSHSMVTGKIEDSQIFYMNTRGISKKDAKDLIIKNKINNVLKNYDEKTKKFVEALI